MISPLTVVRVTGCAVQLFATGFATEASFVPLGPGANHFLSLVDSIRAPWASGRSFSECRLWRHTAQKTNQTLEELEGPTLGSGMGDAG